ncbi:MAG: hypothetical protein E7461_00610 [Ruminococcaceae bacterium]|nr:hypothetical protein [Oscillospiraceae bacterium]
MKYIKRYILLSALLALLIGCFAFFVSAATDDTVSIVYGDLSLSFNAEGCETWQDVVDANDNNMSGGLFIDSKNRVYYYTFDIVEEGPYYVCDAAFDVQCADDPIAFDTIYSFNHITLSFGDFEYQRIVWGASYWFDLADDPLDGLEQYIMTEDDGSMSLVVQNVGTFGIYDDDGDRVDENDEIEGTHYTLLLDYQFTIELYDSSGPTGVKHTVSGLVPSLNLYDLVDPSVPFESDLFAVMGFFTLASDGSIVLVDDSTYDSYYLFNDDGLISELEPSVFATTDPCAAGLHSFTKEVLRREPTCTDAGFIRYECTRCTTMKSTALPARGHNFYKEIVITAPTCDAVGLKGRVCSSCNATDQDSYEEVPKLNHDRNLFGTCKLCGDNSVGNWWNDLWNRDQSDSSGSAGGSSSGSTESKGGFFDWLQDLFSPDEPNEDSTDWFTDFTVKLDALGNSLLVICLGIAGIFFLPYAVKFIKWLWSGIVDGFESIVDLFSDVFKTKKKTGKKHAR